MTEPISVEKGVPLPPEKRGRPTRYPWDEMNVGDSFLYSKRHAMSRHASSAASSAGRSRGWTFTTRKVPEGVRIWRIK